MPNIDHYEAPTIEIHDLTGPVAHWHQAELRQIGIAAWQANLEREPAEVAHAFREEYFTPATEAILHARRRGHAALMAARFTDMDPSEGYVGYISVLDDVSGNPLERFLKTHVARRPPFAWIRNINVLREFQGQGVGSALVRAALDKFDDGQKPTAYVFDENQTALTFFGQLGFSLEPTDQEPKRIEGYFGPGTRPVYQWRFEAPGLQAVREAIARRPASAAPAYRIVDQT